MECVDSDELTCVQQELERVADELRAAQASAAHDTRRIAQLVGTVNSFAVEEAATLRAIGVRQRRLQETSEALDTVARQLGINLKRGQPAERVRHLSAEFAKRMQDARGYLDRVINSYEARFLPLQNRSDALERELVATRKSLAEARQWALLGIGHSEVHVITPVRGKWGRIVAYNCGLCQQNYDAPEDHRIIAAGQPNSSV